MNERLTRRDFLLGVSASLLSGAALLSGCGGGGGGSTADGGYHPDLNRFTPNYANLIGIDHWPTLPVTVYFASDLTITPQGGSPTRVNDVIQSGFQRWPDATGGVIGYRVVSDPSAANIVVTTKSIPDPSGQSETGYTQVHTGRNNVLTSATTEIYVWPDITVDELLGGQVSTSAHEFGHMLGIAGHSDNPGDVMYVSHDPTQDVPLSVRDINTIKTIYYFLFP